MSKMGVKVANRTFKAVSVVRVPQQTHGLTGYDQRFAFGIKRECCFYSNFLSKSSLISVPVSV